MSRIPSDVQRFASNIDRGDFPDDMPEYIAEQFTKVAACGSPYYVHQDTGWTVVRGARGKSAIITPHQMDRSLSVSRAYFQLQAGEDDDIIGLLSDDLQAKIRNALVNDSRSDLIGEWVTGDELDALRLLRDD